ncbi:MAG: hypothetical protein OJF51_000601 [Nitrospira sp.]|nr:MAG: hypothetical protein OJF51_000601 [Nitrospira sp.]
MRFSLTTLLCLFILAVGSPVSAKNQQPKKPDPQTMMETYKKLATPGEQHKKLAELEGTWITQTKHWMEPGKPPEETAGTCEMHMMLDGRFLRQECTGEMMGQPFTGIEVTGYDNYTKKYVTTWKSTMGTGLFVMHGTGSTDGKTITLKGDHSDPFQGVMKHRAVWKVSDSNTQLFEMYHVGKDGKEMKGMEIRYERKQ